MLKLATKDWHPRDHVSFASNHPPPHNRPFVSTTTIVHPSAPSRSFTTQLWPPHCIQGSRGAGLVSGLDVARLDHIVEKGQDPRVEMYSAFTDPFHEGELPWHPESTSVCTSELPRLLKKAGVTDVFVVGLATDFCVKHTAEDAVKFGYRVWMVTEATRAVGGEKGQRKAEEEMTARGVKMVALEGEEVGWVRDLAA